MTATDWVGTILTVVIFVLMVVAYVYAYRPKNKEKLEQRKYLLDDGEQLDLSSNESNFFIEGGPFQTRIEDQNYVMASYDFNLVLNRIIETLELPYGEPWAMYCHPFQVVEGLYTDLPVPDYFP